MPEPTPRSISVNALTEILFDRLEAAHELGVERRSNDIASQRRRWLSLFNAANDIASIARSLDILTRAP